MLLDTNVFIDYVRADLYADWDFWQALTTFVNNLDDHRLQRYDPGVRSGEQVRRTDMTIKSIKTERDYKLKSLGRHAEHSKGWIGGAGHRVLRKRLAIPAESLLA